MNSYSIPSLDIGWLIPLNPPFHPIKLPSNRHQNSSLNAIINMIFFMKIPNSTCHLPKFATKILMVSHKNRPFSIIFPGFSRFYSVFPRGSQGFPGKCPMSPGRRRPVASSSAPRCRAPWPWRRCSRAAGRCAGPRAARPSSAWDLGTWDAVTGGVGRGWRATERPVMETMGKSMSCRVVWMGWI